MFQNECREKKPTRQPWKKEGKGTEHSRNGDIWAKSMESLVAKLRSKREKGGANSKSEEENEGGKGMYEKIPSGNPKTQLRVSALRCGTKGLGETEKLR